MKLKNGFTLIEIIIVVALMALIAVVVSTNMSGMYNKQKDSEYARVKEDIISATKTYVGLNKDGRRDKAISDGSVEIKLEELIKAGYLDEEELIDPRKEKGDQNINSQNIVVVTYDSTNLEFKYTYNYE